MSLSLSRMVSKVQGCSRQLKTHQQDHISRVSLPHQPSYEPLMAGQMSSFSSFHKLISKGRPAQKFTPTPKFTLLDSFFSKMCNSFFFCWLVLAILAIYGCNWSFLPSFCPGVNDTCYNRSQRKPVVKKIAVCCIWRAGPWNKPQLESWQTYQKWYT